MSGGTTAAWVAAGAAVASTGVAAYSASQAGKGGELQETSQGRQAASMALDQYNTYLKEFKPTEQAFIADVMKPTAVEEAKQIGKVNADIAQKMAVSPGDPNRLLRNPTKFTDVADYEAKADNNAVQGVQNKQILGEQAVVDIGLGRKNTAQLGMNNLASEAQQNAIAEEKRRTDQSGAITNAVGSGVGAVGGIAKNWPVTPVDYAGMYNPGVDYSDPSNITIPVEP